MVVHGDVESIALKNPKELTGLFEQISGSEELKKDYEGDCQVQAGRICASQGIFSIAC